METYDYALYIGRFQPFHNGHMKVVQHGLTIAKKLIIFVGSTNGARTIKNPFTFEERRDMILNCFDPQIAQRITIIPLRDYFYNDEMWFAQIQNLIAENVDGTACVIGAYKDNTNYYFKYFADYQLEFVKADNINATDIRDIMFNEHCGMNDYADKTPPGVCEWITQNKIFDTEEFKNLLEEFKYVEKYKEIWKLAPFPPTFVTVDAIVIQYGHVLVVKRKMNPGKGLYALPGGFIKQDEPIQDAMIRELKEETRIRVDAPILRSKIVDQKVFDYPGRSLRGRTITHAYCIKLDIGKGLPEVKGGDDAALAKWIPIADVFRKENEFFEDHAQIINYFVNRAV